MIERIESSPRDEFADLSMRLTAAGHTVIPERLTFRHRDFKHDLHPDTIVRVRNSAGEVVPYKTSKGNTVKVGQLHPERVDLALDAEGIVYNSNDFRERYLRFISVTLPDFCDASSEPIPDAAEWVTSVRDPWSESLGDVKVDFDPAPPKEITTTRVESPTQDRILESIAALQERQGEALQAAIEKLASAEEPRRGPGRPRKDSN